MIDQERQVGSCREVREVRDEAALGRAHVVGRDGDYRVGAGLFSAGKKHHRFGMRFRGYAGYDWSSTVRSLGCNVDELCLLVQGEGCRFAARRVDEQAMSALFDLPFYKFSISIEVNFTALERNN